MPKRTPSADEINLSTLAHIRDTPVPRTFPLVLRRYEAKKKILKNARARDPSKAVADYFREIITQSRADVTDDARGRLPDAITTDLGRSNIFQALVKNAGENLTSLVAYNLAENLMGTGWAVVRGKPTELRALLNLEMNGPDGSRLNLPIEADVTVYRPHDLQAVVFSAKTTLKERLHIAVMWRLLIEAAKEPLWAQRLGVIPPANIDALRRLLYCFVTTDLGERGDLLTPRNLIKADASFFDYFFAARHDLPHIAKTIGSSGRKQIFHRLSCVYELLGSL